MYVACHLLRPEAKEKPAITATPRTVYSAVGEFGAKAEARFAPACRAAQIAYPPARVTLLAFKAEKRLEVWGADATGGYRRLADYPILAASGEAGPKRLRGDWQVPEGAYRITALNPNSRFHLSFRVDYPNRTDIAHSAVPRADMGDDIYVHGGAVSVGCIALGDPVIEEVFCLVAQARASERRILIAPCDLRAGETPPANEPWVGALYARLQKELRARYTPE